MDEDETRRNILYRLDWWQVRGLVGNVHSKLVHSYRAFGCWRYLIQVMCLYSNYTSRKRVVYVRVAPRQSRHRMQTHMRHVLCTVHNNIYIIQNGSNCLTRERILKFSIVLVHKIVIYIYVVIITFLNVEVVISTYCMGHDSVYKYNILL